MFGKRRRELEAIRVAQEQARVKKEQADRETARQFQRRTDAAVEKNDFSALKAITKEAREKGFVNWVIDRRIEDHEKEMQKQDEEEINRHPQQAVKTHLARGNVHKAIYIAANKGLKNEEIAIRQRQLKEAADEGRHSEAVIHAARLGELTGNPYYQVAERSSRTAEVKALNEYWLKEQEQQSRQSWPIPGRDLPYGGPDPAEIQAREWEREQQEKIVALYEREHGPGSYYPPPDSG